jgi:hypothetical protein
MLEIITDEPTLNYAFDVNISKFPLCSTLHCLVSDARFFAFRSLTCGIIQMSI